jgi:Cof subfamily protein (haloacid dehalogenase superfamily)
MVGALSATAPISLLVSDVDGTLVTRDKRLTAANISAAARLTHAGIRLSLVSSRPPAGFAMLTGPLQLTAPIGAFNGGAILQPDLVLIEETRVPAEAARLALASFAEFGLDAWLDTKDTWYVTRLDGAYVAKERHTIAQEPTLVPSFKPYLDQVGKLVGSSEDFDRVMACEAALQAVLGRGATAKRSQPYYLDVTPHGFDKGEATRRIARLLDVPLNEVAVIGDMANDMPMFEVASFRIAMGNGIDALKQAADFVTDDNEHDGFATAVDRFILPRAPMHPS